MSFRLLFEFSGLAMLHLKGPDKERSLEVLLSDRGKGDSRHIPRLVLPVENIGNVEQLVSSSEEMSLGLEIVIGPRGQYLCNFDLAGSTLDAGGSGRIETDGEKDPTVQPMSVDDWRPLDYLPNVRRMAGGKSSVDNTQAAASFAAAGGYLYAAPSPNEPERHRLWYVVSGKERRKQYLADRAVLEMEVNEGNLPVKITKNGKSVNLLVAPPSGDRAADVVVAISSHCCLSRSPGNHGGLGPPIEDLVGYDRFIKEGLSLENKIVQAPENTEFTVGNPRCPSAVYL